MERAASEARRIAVLTGGHGRGSNLRAIHEYFERCGFPARVELVIGDKQDTPVPQLCKELGLRFVYLPSRNMAWFEKELLSLLKGFEIKALALAGFLKLLSEDFLEHAGVPVLNIHPALIPKYCGTGMYGIKVHQAVFAEGDTVSGVTIHLVDAVYDHGQIVAQQEVDIQDCHSPEEIAARVLKIEHQIYAPAILEVLFTGLKPKHRI